MELILRCICGRTRRLRVESEMEGISGIPENTSFLSFPNSHGKFVWLCLRCSRKAAAAPKLALEELEDDITFIEDLIKK